MRLRRDAAYWAVAAGAGLWLAAAFVAPFGRSRGWAGASLLYAFFHPVCHQIAERSFACFGHPVAVCHRCLGLYAGFFAGLVLWPALPRPAARLLDRPRWVLAFSAPLAVDAAIRANTGASRFATGLVAAFPVALLLLVAVAQLATRRRLSTEETYASR